ncbi:MAG: 4-hydroxythreonine-4-phosphate dehydrogenase PdxA [Rhodobacteraceae bacterium]|nr:4-hydroxythreonine-4-phosphate dehydrogenase PdxA [Paracoccaceae bacterium]
MNLPVALTCGEPAGVAPEITVAAWAALHNDLPFFVIGDRRHFQAAANAASVRLVEIDAPAEATAAVSVGLPILQHDFYTPVVPGNPKPENASAVIDVIRRGVEYVQAGQCCAVCTNPINKQVLKEGAGFPYPGHTEYLAALGGVTRSVMMLTAPELRVVPVTIHIPLAEVPDQLTGDLLEQTIRTTHLSLTRDFGVAAPRLAIAGLNPHAGEGGAMGTEEGAMIAPLLARLRQEGLNLSGPMSADTMFHPAARASYDAAICMYHDQALIPIKTVNFSAGVNVTLGLPFIRTSPDHGTAFNIAGQGKADPTSLIEALKTARNMAETRAAHDAQHA